MRLIDADELKKNFQDDLCYGIACADCSMQNEGFCRAERWIDIQPTIEAEPIKMMCNGDHIKCPAHKDYERGYKDGQAEAQMKTEPIKHGRWTGINRNRYNDDEATCSICGETFASGYSNPSWWDYCPNCGSRMDGKSEAEERYNPCLTCSQINNTFCDCSKR